jgi:hypothetical protein
MGSNHEIWKLYTPPLIWWPRSSCDCWDWYKSSLNLRCGFVAVGSRKNKQQNEKKIKRKGIRTNTGSQFTYYVVNLVLMALAKPEHFKERRTLQRMNSDFCFFFPWFQDRKIPVFCNTQTDVFLFFFRVFSLFLNASLSLVTIEFCRGKIDTLFKQTPWAVSASEIYRQSDRRLSAKLVPIFADRGCYMFSVTDPYGLILGFLDRSRYFLFQVDPQLYSRG